VLPLCGDSFMAVGGDSAEGNTRSLCGVTVYLDIYVSSAASPSFQCSHSALIS
jgi:hypothetical protein